MRLARPSLILAAALLSACAAAPQKTAAPAPSEIAAHDNLNATLWMQTAIEYEAATRSIFGAAKYTLDAALADTSWNALPANESSSGFETKPPAIIVDLDETFIDNSPYQARSIADNAGFTLERWQQWVNAKKALALPGALEFAQYAASRGVTFFYVTNRDAPAELAATIENVKQLGFPVKEDFSNFVLRGDSRAPEREKGTRRKLIDRDYRVVMLFGDNFGDFLDGINSSIETRKALAAPYAEWWGRRWFMLPNPSYGSWENAILRSCADQTNPAACRRAALHHDY